MNHSKNEIHQELIQWNACPFPIKSLAAVNRLNSESPNAIKLLKKPVHFLIKQMKLETKHEK